MTCKPIGRASTNFPYSWNTCLLVKQFGKKNLTLHDTTDGHWKAKEESTPLSISTDPRAPRTEISNPFQYPGHSLTLLIYKHMTYNAQFPSPHHQLHTDTFTPLYEGRCICLFMGLLWRNLRLPKLKEEQSSRRDRVSEGLYRGNHPLLVSPSAPWILLLPPTPRLLPRHLLYSQGTSSSIRQSSTWKDRISTKHLCHFLLYFLLDIQPHTGLSNSHNSQEDPSSS